LDDISGFGTNGYSRTGRPLRRLYDANIEYRTRGRSNIPYSSWRDLETKVRRTTVVNTFDNLQLFHDT